LRREGADFVAAVTHADRKQDIEILSTRAVDLLLTGHDHDLYVSFDGRNAVVEASQDAYYVTVVSVTITVKEQDGKREVAWWPDIQIIDTANVTPDAEVAAVVAGFQAEFTREMQVPLGKTAVELDSRNATVRSSEAAIGNLFADAMRAAMRTDVAVTNGGGIRAGKLYPAGSPITRRDILAELPFSNRLVALEMTGRDLKQAIENGLSHLPDATGRFPQISGMTVEADPRRPAGQRVLSIRVGDAPLSETRRYSVATSDFLARGSDGYTTFRDAKRLQPEEDSPLLANEVMTHIRRLGTVNARAEGRIVLK
jgi:2',3'-cyclic-nucleotide 2'-phosphodiesterase (5'-nucleotidase family)